jgi:putative glutamine amidotransferase
MKIVMPGWKVGENSFGITVPYHEFLSKIGKVQILSPGVYEDVDLLVLPGGLDVSPERYGAIPSLYTSNTNMLLEYFDANMLPKYIATKTRIFGICRGLQTINVIFGGTLQQDILHKTSTTRDERVHKISTIESINGKNTFKVNSLHHQAVDKLANSLCCFATSEDNYVEAIYHKSLPIAACQFHPEELGYEPVTNFLLNKILQK